MSNPIETAARRNWAAANPHAGECSESMIPDEAALAEFVSPGAAANAVAMMVFAGPEFAGDYTRAMLDGDHTREGSNTFIRREMADMLARTSAVIDTPPGDTTWGIEGGALPGSDDKRVLAVWWMVGALGKVEFARLDEIHVAWEARPGAKHPLGPLVRAWQQRPIDVNPDTREIGIMPKPAASIRSMHETGRLFANLPRQAKPGRVETHEDMFNNLPELKANPNEIVPSLPLILFDAAGGKSTQPGRGAPLALRLFVETMLSTDRALRNGGRAQRLAITLDDLIELLWPNGWTGPGRDAAKLERAIWLVDNAFVPWSKPDGTSGGMWKMVSVRNVPDMRNRKSALIMEIDMPPGSHVGPMVHRPTLRKWGVDSAPAYRLALSLAYIWNERLTANGRRIPPRIPEVRRNNAGYILDATGNIITAKGKPATHWSTRGAIQTGKYLRNEHLDRLPALTDDDLVNMAFGDADRRDPAKQRNRRRQARAALRAMVEANDVVAVENGEGKTLIEPPEWWGRLRDD